MHRGRSLDVIVSAEILRAPWARLVEPERFTVASLVAELVDAFCEPDLPLADVYDLLGAMLEAIAASDAPQSLIPRFSLRLLDSLGLAPPPRHCVRCGTPLDEDAPAWVDPQAGGLIDERCRERWRDLLELDERERENFRGLCAPKGAPGAASRATPRVARAIADLLAHHLGHCPKADVHLLEFVAEART
jgi:recombinational DNA repair protein (RecF pathway)